MDPTTKKIILILCDFTRRGLMMIAAGLDEVSRILKAE